MLINNFDFWLNYRTIWKTDFIYFGTSIKRKVFNTQLKSLLPMFKS